MDSVSQQLFMVAAAGNDPSALTLAVDSSLSASFELGFTGPFSVTINWGDGQTESQSSATAGSLQIYPHTYSSSGTFVVRITGSAAGFGGGDNTALVRCLSFGNLGVTSLENAFSGAPNLISVPNTLPSSVTKLDYAFFDAPIFNQNLASWNTANVTSMLGTFRGATAFNQDIGGWDVSAVERFDSMFQNATAFNQDIGGWDVSGASFCASMFSGATAFNQDIGGWDVSNVWSMAFMFSGATAFNQDLSGWCVGNFQAEPTNFAASSGLSAENKPVWGTCPNYVTDGSITYIGAASGTTSATLPAHQAGDLILCFGFRDGSTSAISRPAGWSFLAGAGANTCYGVLSYKIAASSSETTGTWTNASTVVFLVYRGDYDIERAVLFQRTATGSSTTVTYPEANFWKDLAWTVAFAGHRSTDGSLETPPGTLTLRDNTADATDETAAFDSTAVSSGFNSTDVSIGGTSSGWRTFVLRLRNKITPAP